MGINKKIMRLFLIRISVTSLLRCNATGIHCRKYYRGFSSAGCLPLDLACQRGCQGCWSLDTMGGDAFCHLGLVHITAWCQGGPDGEGQCIGWSFSGMRTVWVLDTRVAWIKCLLFLLSIIRVA